MSGGFASALLRVARNVADLPRAAAFYREALGFEIVEGDRADPGLARLLGGDGARLETMRLALGAQEIELGAFEPPGAPYPKDSSAADLWFQHIAIVTSDIAAAVERVRRHGAIPITRGGPQLLPASAGGVTAYKFRDPDFHPLELIEFPPGTGDPAWQRAPAGRIAIGIDHSALSVADSGRSVRFYADLLGLRQMSRGVNHGPEQVRLDDLDDVRVEIVALQPASRATPHVELLGYRTPRGRPKAPQSRPSDGAATRLVLQVENLSGIVAALAAASPSTAVSEIIALADGSSAALTEDPDGHTLLLIE
jgi:catechol 2,3-dioxygenase-like lactoylglutathione lyase family enzyme